MSAPNSNSMLAIAIALLVFVVAGWQLVLGLARVQTAQSRIASFSSARDQAGVINPAHWVIEAGSHGGGGARVQARLRASARAADISLTRVEIQPKDASDPALIRASAQANGNVKAMARFIYELESKEPALVLERARMSNDGQGGIDLDLVLLARMQSELTP